MCGPRGSMPIDLRALLTRCQMASSTSPESAAQRIPPELFKRIIDNLKPQELDGSTRLAWTKSRKTKKLRGQQQKHELGQCSLVCRYWAVHCRGPIFRNVEIRTLEDAHRLLEFAKTSTIGISIGSYISSITVRAAVPSLPWIHLITNAIPHDAFPNLNSYTINVSEAPFSEAPELRPFAPRSVFYGLPRSLPATKRPLPLSLRDLRFAAFADMISFIESFVASKPRSHSASLYLDQITWADGNTLMPSETPAAFRGMRRRWRKHFKSIVSNNCTDAWPLVWLLVTAERPKPSLNRTPPFVDGMEVRRLTALVQVIMDNCQCTICSERKSGHKSTSSPGHLPSVFMKEVEPERGSRGVCSVCYMPKANGS
ncbi:uncharacterized protein PHACADRAFT_254870 [Phanerochaete carnosa HHB-10118-sp]|uniref:F-box domain-containing protein n=1 Tax=Phanerochaete carnosa (strain HHB-10118-sp) TaxID=650164 RepID=K5V3Q9_PHACS|nr:uncharacterized protein PHACADRAFT_254870 [Phanerochaete carnosa HHB-10118-sp]EKM57221.1 hypothetical protein PHACADRAFT_254870 [Phanerochaete carnosa HHB-10118-sp]